MLNAIVTFAISPAYTLPEIPTFKRESEMCYDHLSIAVSGADQKEIMNNARKWVINRFGMILIITNIEYTKSDEQLEKEYDIKRNQL